MLNIYPRTYKKILAVSFLLWFFVADIVWAQGYVPLEALPGVTDTGTNLTEYLSAIFNLGIGLAGVFAVLMIVVGGVQYIAGAASPSARSEAKKRITSAILGLLLAVSSWLIVYIINPDLIKNTLSITPTLIFSAPTSVSTPTLTPTSIPTPIPTPTLIPIPTPISTPTPAPTPPPTLTPTPIPPPVFYTPPSIYTLPPPPPPDTTNDYNLIKGCFSADISGVCASADLDSDGVIGISDLLFLANSFKYNVNGDEIIDLTVSSPITYCFLKENSGPVLSPNPPCDSDYSISGCVPPPEVRLFPISCVTDSNISKVLSLNEFNKLKNVLRQSIPSGESRKINLRTLYNKLFYACSDDFSIIRHCDFFRYEPLNRIIYSTIIQYDTNKDGFADFNGDDPVADFNGDGVVNDKDSEFIIFLNESVFKDGGFMPIDFTVGGVEALMFDSSGFTDRQIIEYCINKMPIMDCAMADLDGSCTSEANSTSCAVSPDDLNKFNTEAPVFDINGDGVVNFSPPAP